MVDVKVVTLKHQPSRLLGFSMSLQIFKDLDMKQVFHEYALNALTPRKNNDESLLTPYEENCANNAGSKAPG